MKIKYLYTTIVIMLLVLGGCGANENGNSDVVEVVGSIDTHTTEEKEVIEEIKEIDPILIEEEKEIVEQAYTLLWDKAIKADGGEAKELLRDVQSLVKSYPNFKSDYRVDAHILYLYAEQSLLIKSYRENMSGNGTNEMGKYDNHETYGQKFADKHKSTMIKHIQELDPYNNGAFLPSHVVSSLGNGLENFFDITREDWIEIYNNSDVNWVESAESEAKENIKLRTMNPQIGMSQEEVIKTKWGKPTKINKTTNAYGTSEQWVYPNYNYLYFDDGILTSISN